MSTKNSSILTKKYKLILSAVHMVYRLVNSTYNVKEMVLRLARLLCQFIKTDTSIIYLLDPKKKRIILKASFNNKINILIKSRKELEEVSAKEKRVLDGYIIYEKHFIGIPLVSDETIGAIFVKRKPSQEPFEDFDKELLSVVVEQSVVAIKSLQFYEEQQKVILESMKFIGKLLEKQGHFKAISHTPVYFKIVKALAEKLQLREEDINNLYYASVLRDAGMVDVPYEILSKTSQLTPEEFKVIRKSPTSSAELIRPVEFLKPVLPFILYRHEKYDGTGYPSGLRKEQIPLGARVMSVVDAFEAMTRERPYKMRLSVIGAIDEIKENSGTQFDPKVVSAFISLAKQKKFKNYLSSAKE